MPTREELIGKLSAHFDPRSASWQNRVILDTLQEEEPCNITDLQRAISEEFDCEDLLTYHQVRDSLLVLHSQGIVKNDALTKRFSITPEYRTHEVEYLPVSSYCVALWAASAIALAVIVIYNIDQYMLHAVLLTTVGSLYLIGQYLGSEFEFNGTCQKLKTILHMKKP